MKVVQNYSPFQTYLCLPLIPSCQCSAYPQTRGDILYQLRDKEERKAKEAVSGLFKDIGELKPEYQNEMDAIENSIKTYLNVSLNS